MANYQRVRLSELIFQNTTPEKITDMQNERYLTVALYGKGVRERVIKEGKYPVPFTGYRVSEGQFIYSRIDARNGAYGIIEPEYDGFVVSKDFPVYDIDTSRIQSQFLLMSVLGGGFLRQVKNSSFGATNRMRIKEETLESYSIILPPMEEQSRIVEIISKAQCIIDRYQRQICILDDLIKARFVEMFSNRGYTLVKLGKVCSRITDGTHKTPTYLQDGVKFISAKNIINGELNFSDVKYISETEYQEIQNRCQTERLDILLSKSGSLGSPAIVRTEIKLGLFESLAVLKYDRKQLLPEFLCEQLKTESIQRQFTLGTKGVAIKHLHLGVIADTDIIIPPISEQKEFADFVKRVDKSKVVVQKALDEAKLLLDSLMQKYFG